jgi:hypothetical protein
VTADVVSAGVIGVVIVVVGMMVMVGMVAVGVDVLIIHVGCGVVVDVVSSAPATKRPNHNH